MFDINAWEAVIILVVALVVIGPDRLPEYAAKLGRMVRRGKEAADAARGQLREQMGPEFDDINWRAYDPRQYDPRRIVREALEDAPPVHQPGHPTSGSSAAGGPARPPTVRPAPRDPMLPTPFDDDAT